MCIDFLFPHRSQRIAQKMVVGDEPLPKISHVIQVTPVCNKNTNNKKEQVNPIRSACAGECELECIICLAQINASQLTSLDCGHKFHTDCIQKWLQRAGTCPLCRCMHKTHPELVRFRHIANILVSNNIISQQEADTQLGAVSAFFQGKMSYAEMRALAG
jgi:SUMO ligase MMS21 Smc5/6 complex component